ncbi:hypothetical protein [Levilactobacillus enshiensis]|uniref:hypothetical protein n=1 Tax=Levilactobacillus enshiensis TaxID=2590213 RepID=UPI001179D6FA|nr:hypothetical protein [Levilactobacillus enshiensis]
MKLLKATSILLAATTFGAALVAVTPAATAHAAKRTMLKSYPKNMRRTWYRYEKGQYVSTKITAKKNSGVVLHYFNPNKKWPTITKKNLYWAYAYKMNNGVIGSGPWGSIKSENWTTVNDLGALFDQKVTTKTYKGKKIKVLKELYANSQPATWRYSYTSKKLAKHFNPKGTVLWAADK